MVAQWSSKPRSKDMRVRAASPAPKLMKRNGLETRIAKLRKENNILARKVANKLMGVHRYAVVRGRKVLRYFTDIEEAKWFAAHQKSGFFYYIEEIVE